MPDGERLTAIIESVVERAGAELVDLERGGSGGRPVIRVFVDMEGGILLDACARISRAIETELEAAEAVPDRYVIEVSSPGIERPLRTREQFERFAGRPVQIRLHRKRGNRKRFVGTLKEVLDVPGKKYAVVVAGDDDETWTFADDEIARARLYVEW